MNTISSLPENNQLNDLLVNLKDFLKKEINDIIDGKKPFSTVPWRVASLGIWYKMVTGDNN